MSKKVYEDAMVVDENDEPVGRMQMPEAYAAGKILRVVEVAVINSQNEILLQKRGPNVLAPNLWAFSAGGHVDHAETYQSAMVRELEEEMGVSVKEEQLHEFRYFLERGERDDHTYQRYRKDYVVLSDQEPAIDNDEVAGYKYISLDDLEAEFAKDTSVYMPSLVESLSKIKQTLASI